MFAYDGNSEIIDENKIVIKENYETSSKSSIWLILIVVLCVVIFCTLIYYGKIDFSDYRVMNWFIEPIKWFLQLIMWIFMAIYELITR